MNFLTHLLDSLGAGEISGIVIGVIGALAGAVVTVIKALGEFYASKGCTKCPITKRCLKSTIEKQKNKKAKQLQKEPKI